MVIKERVILWDWNGTLLDDTKVCLTTMNSMLRKRNIPTINLKRYKEVFSFPVVEYYQKIGFDFKIESFENLSIEFINAYTSDLHSAPLVPHTEQVLKVFSRLGKENVIISAMKQDRLTLSVMEKGLNEYFKDILGIRDIYAASKISLALEYVKNRGLNASEIVLIGDTDHDFEVSSEIGCKCILIADGHQSKERLRATGAYVILTLTELLPSILPKSL
ncbi:Phosphoglycolate phosphatase [subsurface metagenome]